MEKTQGVDLRNSKYVAAVCRDRKMALTFLKFRNRVEHPLSGVYMFVIGAMLIFIPLRNPGIARTGTIICYVMGALLVCIALFRNTISLSLMKGSPEYKENEKLTYYFGSSTVRTVKEDGKVETTDYYRNVKTLWEDEKHYYIGVNDVDLIVLPKTSFLEGDPAQFRDFILEKSGAKMKWTPAKPGNIIKDKLYKMQYKFGKQEEES